MEQKSRVGNCPQILKFRQGCFIRNWKFPTTQSRIFHPIENGILGCRKSVIVFTFLVQRSGSERSWRVIARVLRVFLSVIFIVSKNQ